MSAIFNGPATPLTRIEIYAIFKRNGSRYMTEVFPRSDGLWLFHGSEPLTHELKDGSVFIEFVDSNAQPLSLETHRKLKLVSLEPPPVEVTFEPSGEMAVYRRLDGQEIRFPIVVRSDDGKKVVREEIASELRFVRLEPKDTFQEPSADAKRAAGVVSGFVVGSGSIPAQLIDAQWNSKERLSPTAVAALNKNRT